MALNNQTMYTIIIVIIVLVLLFWFLNRPSRTNTYPQFVEYLNGQTQPLSPTPTPSPTPSPTPTSIFQHGTCGICGGVGYYGALPYGWCKCGECKKPGCCPAGTYYAGSQSSCGNDQCAWNCLPNPPAPTPSPAPMPTPSPVPVPNYLYGSCGMCGGIYNGTTGTQWNKCGALGQPGCCPPGTTFAGHQTDCGDGKCAWACTPNTPTP